MSPDGFDLLRGLLSPAGPRIVLLVPDGLGGPIRAGSGPAHLALIGFDPLRFQPGRGVLSARGIGFDLQDGEGSRSE